MRLEVLKLKVHVRNKTNKYSSIDKVFYCLINESLMNDKNLEESNRVADLYGRPLGLGARVSISTFLQLVQK